MNPTWIDLAVVGLLTIMAIVLGIMAFIYSIGGWGVVLLSLGIYGSVSLYRMIDEMK